MSSRQAAFFKLGKYNLLLSILTFGFANCVKFNFGKSYLPSDSDTNTAISDCFACPVKMTPKTTRTGNFQIHEFDWLKSILKAV